ncbi:hypothetical protein PILCRDRAFT_98758 [Piloderma croceum F 1598]|uniref:Uncharacterized protein n=1 Tax=Piloderma croceum (strain F 1598) TaxID=765440 RepID=A0A0C3F9J4_PILCF|nr:hypothetical protein PILCRDRAFT_98758 [Piloderma croceum F 1598]
MNQSSPYTAPRRTHRKRHSAIRLSSDTTATLPVYTSPVWQRPHDLPEDSPPDYPESAEEADEDTDTDDNVVVYAPPSSPPPLLTPRRTRRYHHPGAVARRRATGSTSDLDSLLQRSVHALEMSNALLQSSMSTQSSLSTLLAADNATDRSLDRTTRSISTRIRGNGDVHENWMDDLDEITKGVNGLFGDDAAARNSAESLVSRSLPTSSMPNMPQRHRRRPSLNFRAAAMSDTGPHLHLSAEVDRAELISPAPRAMTLYVASTDDPDSIVLPSTLGLRTCGSAHNSGRSTPVEPPPPPTMSHASLSTGLHASASLPVLTDKPSEPSTPAYNLLSSFVTHQASCPGPSNERAASLSESPSKRLTQASPDNNCLGRRGPITRSRSLTPIRLASPSSAPRPMTPPIEELSGSSSSASSDNLHAYRTMKCLRKILDEQPPPNDKIVVEIATPQRLKAPAFFPRTPPPVASSSTSTATASVSRLFTKSTHHSSTRPPSPPQHSSLKRSSGFSTPTTATPSPTSPGFLSAGVARITGSASSSGRSTPKRISFAELPESYANSRPIGSSRFKEKKNRSRSKTKAKSQADRAGEENGAWWVGWLLGGAGTEGVSALNFGAQRHEERLEDRAARSWGGRSGFGAVDDWAV